METRYDLVRATILCLALGLMLGLGTAIASDNAAKSDDSKAAVTAQTDGTAGLMVAIDKDTGLLRAPTSTEAKQLDDAWDKALKAQFSDHLRGATRLISADGAHGLKLGPAFQEYDMVSIGPDGKLRYGNASSEKDAIKWMKDNVTSTEDESR